MPLSLAVATDRLSETGQRRQGRAAVLTDSGRAERKNRSPERQFLFIKEVYPFFIFFTQPNQYLFARENAVQFREPDAYA